MLASLDCQNFSNLLVRNLTASFSIIYQFKTLADLSREEIAIAKRYPSHTALCIRGGWELCRSEQAVGM